MLHAVWFKQTLGSEFTPSPAQIGSNSLSEKRLDLYSKLLVDFHRKHGRFQKEDRALPPLRGRHLPKGLLLQLCARRSRAGEEEMKHGDSANLPEGDNPRQLGHQQPIVRAYQPCITIITGRVTFRGLVEFPHAFYLWLSKKMQIAGDDWRWMDRQTDRWPSRFISTAI